MGSKNKQTSTQNYNNQSTVQWGQITPNDTPDIEKLRSQEFKVDPGLGYQYGTLKQRLRSGFNNPLGAYYNPQVKEAIVRSGEERLGQEEAQAFREGQNQVNALDFARNSSVAELTSPKIVQTGGTNSGSGTGTVVQSSGTPWGTIIGAGAQVGAAAA